MQAFNLTRLNFHSPYKVWIDNGSYKFLTDYGVQYRIEFVENNNIWEDEKAYEFGILNENKKNSPNDSKVKATIQCIIEEFFLTNIVQTVKICYKRKIDSRDFRGSFYSFLELRRHSNSSFVASLPCKSCPFAWH